MDRIESALWIALFLPLGSLPLAGCSASSDCPSALCSPCQPSSDSLSAVAPASFQAPTDVRPIDLAPSQDSRVQRR